VNRTARILHNVKSETAQREKYNELILDCVNTGIIVLNDNGAVYQKNNEALRLLGLEVFTHVRQLSRVDAHLTDTLTACRANRSLAL
jgi:nitrogen fixation/metabolism regulation signal transduction histidine kinase